MQTRHIAAAVLIGSLSSFTWAATPAQPPDAGSAGRIADAALAEFVRSVIDASPRVRAARAGLDASTAFQAAADRPLYNPSLEFQGENADSDTRSIGISQTFDWAGKRSARTAVATSDRLAVEAEYVATRQSVAVELLSGLAAYQSGMDRGELADERVRLMREFATLAQRRYDAGDMPRVELTLANLVFTDARMQRATVAAELVEARQQVRNLTLTAAAGEWPQLDTRLPGLPMAANLQPYLLILPEVQAAQRRVDSALSLVELRKREKRLDPTLSFAGGEEDNSTLIGLNLSIPIPVRNSFSHEVTAARAQYRQAQQQADDVLRRAQARLVSASERYRLSQSAWSDWEKTGQLSLQNQGELLRRLWQSGELSTTDFLVQIGQTIDSRDRALDLRQAFWRAWFEWLAASGQVDKRFGLDRGI